MKLIAIVTSLLVLAVLWLVHASHESSAAERPHALAPSAPRIDTPTTPTRWSSDPAPAIVTPIVNAPPPPSTDDDLAPAAQSRRLADRFAAERADTSWATTAEQQLHGDLGRVVDPDVELAHLECRTTLCRLELAYTKPDAGMTFMQKWLATRTWTGPGVAANEPAAPDGPQRMVVFLEKPTD